MAISTPLPWQPLDEETVRGWLVTQGFQPGDFRTEISVPLFAPEGDEDDEDIPGVVQTPMARACEMGELSLCKWLYDHGAAEDITKKNENGDAPMHWACDEGHLEVCKWLYDMGADEGIARTEGADDADDNDEHVYFEDDNENGNAENQVLLSRACRVGHLSICEWLFEVGADGDVCRADIHGNTPMLVACFHGHLPVCEWLFEMGAAEDICRANNDGDTPMNSACSRGDLPVCKWLFEMGAAEDISRANNRDQTPMHYACWSGNLSLCKWLFEVGADQDISRVNSRNDKPMAEACLKGHLSVCKWLFEVGAHEDISWANYSGWTPMYWACSYDNMSVCEWLVLNGALNRPIGSPASAEDEGGNDQGGHVDLAIVQHDTYRRRCRLFNWAKGVVAIHHTFRHVVLRGSVIMPRHRTSPRRRCYLPRLPRDELRRIGSFLGVETGRRLRNAREFAEALEALGTGKDNEAGSMAVHVGWL